VTERSLTELLREAPVPPADRDRAFAVVRQAFDERDRVSWPRRHARALVLSAAAAAVVAAFASPPGRAVLGSLRDAVGREGVKHAQPALVSLPAPGRLLVQSAKGPWVVQADGSRRLLGRYHEASWSPHGLFLTVTRPNQLLAVDPKGRVRWALARSDVRFPRWTGTRTNTQIAYLTTSRLHVVAGDGSHDVELCGEPAAARVAPAWRPGAGWTLAYATTRGRVYVLDAGRCSLLWRSAPHPRPRLLQWSADGRRLALVTDGKLVVFAGPRSTVRFMPGITSAAFAPRGHALAVVQRGSVLLLDGDDLRAKPRRVFAAAGRLGQLVWSPDGRWLLATWPRADQWLFVRASGGKLLANSHITEQFGGGPFPSLGGWCCSG
jgi:hypothetical protein